MIFIIYNQYLCIKNINLYETNINISFSLYFLFFSFFFYIIINLIFIGYVQEILDEGMPLHEFPSEQGKLYIEYVVAFPNSLTDEQKEGKKIYIYIYIYKDNIKIIY